ncbi:MAG: polysulfide reductase NrfD [Bacteroidia bacterium]|nr:polysulfide reductase NrfD [Bacteroidia bacterium]
MKNEEKISATRWSAFNVISTLIILAGVVIAIIRFAKGIGSVGTDSDEYPWGLLIGVNLLVGVAVSAGGFMVASAVHLFGLKKYRPILRPAMLTGFLGYLFAVIALLCDLGQPWRIVYPVFVSYGVASIMFLVAWHVFLYLSVQFLEFSPAIFEWLGWKNWRRGIGKIIVALCILGVILSLLHQSALGGLFLLAPHKVHPLWYSELIPVFFFVSAMVAGLCMIIIVSMLSNRAFKYQLEEGYTEKINDITLGLGKFGSIILICYFFLKWIGVAHDRHFNLLGTGYGGWFLVEVLVFVLLPSVLFAVGARKKSVSLIRFTAILTIIGILINRLNVSMFTFRWDEPICNVPQWTEIILCIAIITTGIVVFKWIVKRMPVLRKHPDYESLH